VGHRRAISRSAVGAFAAFLLAATAALGPAPLPASAQTVGELPYIDAVDAWADSQSLGTTLRGSTDGSGFAEPADQRPARPSARQLAGLRFARTRAVTERNYQAVMDLLEPGFDPAAVVAEFDRLQALVSKAMRDQGNGWSPNNIAHVSAYMLLSAYGVFHSRPTLPRRSSLAVRTAARNSMALDRRLRGLSDARKQTAVEVLVLRTILRVSDVNVARLEHDATRERAAKAELRSWIREVFSVDLERIRLSRDGLVRR
jgi:hypothetical protein